MKKYCLIYLSLISWMPSFGQWEFVNPLPDGHTIQCVSFADSANGWAFGPGFKRQFVNNQWITQAPLSHENFSKVKLLSATDGWALNYDQIYHFDGSNWVSNFSFPNRRLNNIFFLNPSNGWVVGDSGTVIHYDGTGWNIMSAPTNKRVFSVYFMNDSVGYVGSEDSQLFKYSNNVFTPVSLSPLSNIYDLFDIYAADTNNIFLGTLLGSVIHYDGTSSVLQPTSTNNAIRLHFNSPQDGWVVGDNEKIAHYDGTSWTVVFTDFGDFKDMEFSTPTNAWVVGNYGTMCRFDGTSWSAEHSSLTFSSFLTDVVAVDTAHIFAGGHLGVWQKTDSAWVDGQHPVVNPGLRKMDYYDANHVWAVGIAQGVGFWNGVNWTTIPPGLSGINSFYDVDVVDTNHVWIAGGGGGAIVFWDGSGYSLQYYDATPSSTIHGIAMTDTANGWACGTNGTVFRYQNGAWSAPLPGFGTNRYLGMEFTDANHGWMVEYIESSLPPPIPDSAVIHFYNGTVWAATDTFPYNGNAFVMYKCALHFRDSLHGTLGLGNTQVYYEYNNGSWTEKYVENCSNQINSVFFVDSLNGWAVGHWGLIMHTSNGGVTSGVHDFQNPQTGDLNLRCYPNPVEGISDVEYELQDHGFVNLTLYNIEGKFITRLKNEYQYKGMNRVRFSRKELPSGIYFIVLKTGNHQETIKILLH